MKKKKRQLNSFASEHYRFLKIHILKTTPLSHYVFLKFRNGFNVIILDRMIFSIKALRWQIISSDVSFIGLFSDYGN